MAVTEAAAADSLLLSDYAGRIVEITTITGLIYWVIPLLDHTIEDEMIRGLSVHTSWPNVLGFCVSPKDISAQNVVRVECPWIISSMGLTSPIESVRPA